MQALRDDERTLTKNDHQRLQGFIRPAGARSASPGKSVIDAILDEADLVAPEEVDPDVVTMHSRVLVADLATGKNVELTLCYPHEAEPGRGHISVLSPVGASLLGRRVGSIATWLSPDGVTNEAVVAALLYQPETGDRIPS